MYTVRPRSGGWRGCCRKKGGQDWRAIPSLEAKERLQAEDDLEYYAFKHDMKRVIFVCKNYGVFIL